MKQLVAGFDGLQAERIMSILRCSCWLVSSPAEALAYFLGSSGLRKAREPTHWDRDDPQSLFLFADVIQDVDDCQMQRHCNLAEVISSE